MSRTQTVYVCAACGGETLKWAGQCPHCAEWNTLSRLFVPQGGAAARAVGARVASEGASALLELADPAAAPVPTRLALGMGELDRVFGGGLAAGSVALLGGEPGIGKSTLLLQVAGALAVERPVVYASGEESASQIGLRAARLGITPAALRLVHDDALESIIAAAAGAGAAMLVVDSIQTMRLAALDSGAGSVAQLREGTAALVRFAKSSGTAVVIVGHVTKDGAIAGPKLLEHLVDTVLYFESEAGSRYRILRATKNRFGAVNELGFFAMGERGLTEVRNPSAIFLSRGSTAAPGSVVMVAREGGRPLLIEVQALVDRSRASLPRRIAEGVDANRLSMLLAVLSRHAAAALADFDVFVNVVGGLTITETASDLPVALALASSLRDAALPAGLAAFGEIGLTGEIRPVPHGEERVREAARQGFRELLLPARNVPRESPEGMKLRPVTTVREAFAAVAALRPDGSVA